MDLGFAENKRHLHRILTLSVIRVLLLMEQFSKAKVVRLRSHHGKYLVADDDESVIQDRNGASRQARWTVEFVGVDSKFIRLKSCYGRYLAASNKPYLLGLTGHKVIQDLPARLDSSVEWEPVKDARRVKLKTRYGNFLRANGGTYPYKNSVTHDTPHRTATQDWVMWNLEVVEILTPKAEPQGAWPPQPPWNSSSLGRSSQEEDIKPMPPPPSPPLPARHSSRWASHEDIESMSPRTSPPTTVSNSPNLTSRLSKKEALPRKPNGRMIHYYIADDEGNVDESYENLTIIFEGSELQELAHRLEEELGMDGVIVCTRNVLTGQLSPLRLHLPPNNAKMNVVVVSSSSKVAKNFADQGLI